MADNCHSGYIQPFSGYNTIDSWLMFHPNIRYYIVGSWVCWRPLTRLWLLCPFSLLFFWCCLMSCLMFCLMCSMCCQMFCLMCLKCCLLCCQMCCLMCCLIDVLSDHLNIHVFRKVSSATALASPCRVVNSAKSFNILKMFRSFDVVHLMTLGIPFFVAPDRHAA